MFNRWSSSNLWTTELITSEMVKRMKQLLSAFKSHDRTVSWSFWLPSHLLLQCHILNAIWQQQLSLQILPERAASTSKITQQLNSWAKAYQRHGHLTTHEVQRWKQSKYTIQNLPGRYTLWAAELKRKMLWQIVKSKAFESP